MVESIFLTLLLGCTIGIAVGLLPGLSGSMSLLMLMPLLLKLSPVEVIALYVCIATISQYTGSVSGLLLRIPGENSSLPTLQSSSELYQAGLVPTTLVTTAIGSAVGGIVAVGMIWLLAPMLNWLYQFYGHTEQVIVLGLVIAAVIFLGKNQWYINIGLAIAGAVLAMVGYHSVLNYSFLTFDNLYLSQGLPTYPVLICLFAIPVILQGFDSPKINATDNNKIQWPLVAKTTPSMLRGSIVGWIPGLSFVLSGIAGFTLEKLWSRNKDNVTLRSVTASESANNSGAVSSMIPFMVFGIPIIAAEVILADVLSNKVELGIAWISQSSVLTMLILSVIIANLVGVIAAWPMSQFLIKLVVMCKQWIRYVLILQLLLVIVYLGNSVQQIPYYLVIGIVLTGIGYLLRKLDTLPLLFLFMIFEPFFYTCYRLSKIFF
jgi:putative tricarboxylic transport membrane protein